jgi:hypothetical protein
MSQQDRCVAAVLGRGLDDWVDGSEVAWVVQSVGGATGTAAIRQLALAVIGRIVKDGLMEPGDVTEDGFRAWSVDADVALARIAEAWTPDMSPRPGDVCWLSNTAAGDERARRAQPQPEKA